MVDPKDIESVGPEDDEVDGTTHVFGKICTMNRFCLFAFCLTHVDFRMQALEASRTSVKFCPTTCDHQQVSEILEASFSHPQKEVLLLLVLQNYCEV